MFTIHLHVNLMFIGPCIIVIVEEWKTNLMSLAILFHFLCAQHVSDINISIIRNLRLCCWITTSVVLFSVRCVLEIWCGWFWVGPVLQTEAQVVLQPSSRACDCVVELPHRSFCSQFVACWSFWCGWLWVAFVLQAEAQLNNTVASSWWWTY